MAPKDLKAVFIGALNIDIISHGMDHLATPGKQVNSEEFSR